MRVASVWRFLSIATAVVLTSILVTADITTSFADEVPPSSESSSQIDPIDIPAESSDELVEPVSEMPSGDFRDLGNEIEPTAPVKELPDPEVVEVDPDSLEESSVVDRAEFQETFDIGDGNKVTKLSTEPLNVEDENGEFVPIETNVETVGPWAWLGIGGGAVDLHPLSPEFAETASDEGLLTLNSKGQSVSFTLDGAADSKIVRNAESGPDARSHIEYRDVFAGTDLVYDVTPGTVKENIRLNEKPSASSPVSWQWRVDAGDLAAKKSVDGSIEFRDAANEVVFIVPPAVMADSAAGLGDRGNATSVVQTSLLKRGSEWLIVLSADRSWLEASSRVYPILIDPTASGPINNNDTHAYKKNGQTSVGLGVQVGNTNNGGVWRTVVHYDYEQFFGKQILNAQIAAGSPSSDSSDGGPHWGAVYHATNFGFDSLGDELAGLAIGESGGQTDDVRLASKIAEWVRNGSSGNYLAIRGDESASAFTYKYVQTAMFVGWKEFPNPGTNPIPTNNATRVSLTPELYATGKTDPSGRGIAITIQVMAANGTVIWTSPWTPTTVSNSITLPANILQPNTQYRWKQYVKDADDGTLGTSTVRETPVFTFTTNAAAMPSASAAMPADRATVSTLTPTLSAPTLTSQVGAPIRYQFRIATGSDSVSGTVATSGWIETETGTTDWVVPAGVLQDGGTYRWSVSTKDDIGSYGPIWHKAINVNLRLGTSGPSPLDTVGPVSVNLANGNLSVQFSSPTVKALGGAMGMTFSYNSQKPDDSGLTAYYYDATPPAGQSPVWQIGGRKPVLVRSEGLQSYDWGTQSPGPGVPKDYFIASWKGFVRPPAGKWQFGAYSDDGVRVRIGGSDPLVVDKWTPTVLNSVAYGPSYTFDGSAEAFIMDYYDNTGGAHVTLWAKKDTTACNVTPIPDGCQVIVPSTWFSRSTESLPPGWSASTAIAGPGGSYSRVEVKDSAIILTDTTGTAHTYAKKSNGGYEPPKGEWGSMALTSEGKVNFTDESGLTYIFNSAGRVESTISAIDVKKQASPLVSYVAGTGQIDRISDPLSSLGTTPQTYGREVLFVYEGDTAASRGIPASSPFASGVDCTIPSAAAIDMAAAPEDRLCRILYPADASGAYERTDILYTDTGLVGRIVNPGNAMTSFGYDSAGRIKLIRDPVANAWVQAVNGGVETDTSATTVTYTTTGKVKTVYLPAPNGVTDGTQLKKAYTYSNGYTDVDVTGLTYDGVIGNNARRVTYDSSLRTLTDTSGVGVTSSQVWDPTKDLVLSAKDATGMVTTTLYDSQDRVTDTYGPAPEACFNANRVPSNPCGVTAAHSSQTYDDGLQGLQAAYYANTLLAGVPAVYAKGIASGGSLERDWGTSAPITGIGVDGWSLRLTGLITFPSPGTYSFQGQLDDGMKLWVDNNLLIDNWVSSSDHETNTGSIVVAAGRLTVPIRLEYLEVSGGASLRLFWQGPGVTRSIVPGTRLTPDYGLLSSKTVDDSVPAGSGSNASQVTSQTTSTDYGTSPWLGLPQLQTVDPDGLSLTSKTTYNAETAFNTVAQTFSPAAQSASATTSSTGNSYYGNAETILAAGQVGTSTTVCGTSTSTKQYGQLEVSRSANANTVLGLDALRTVHMYDEYGRLVGTKKTGDTGWSCTYYDTQGRVSKSEIRGLTSGARTVSYTYVADGNNGVLGDPRVSTVKDSVLTGSTTTGGISTTKKDLTGRVVQSTDVWGTVTNNTYDRFGQMTKTAVTVGATTYSTSFTYTVDGKVDTVKDGTTVVADPEYDEFGRLASVTYPTTGVVQTNGFDTVGRVASSTWNFASGVVGSDSVERSQSGRIIADVISDGSSSYRSDYWFDAAGRITKAVIPSHTLTYGYQPQATCTTGLSTAGDNGNRTLTTDVPSQSTRPSYTTKYCYDDSDRMLSATETKTGSQSLPQYTRPLRSLAATDIEYDDHGNQTRLGDQTYTYDLSDRHSKTTLGDGSYVSYLRDATGAIISRTEMPAVGTGQTVVRYSGSLILDGNNGVVQRSLSLPGGASVSIPVSGTTRTWAYPNIHGDITWTTTESGSRSGLYLYDPFGQPIDRSTMIIGNTSADDAVPDLQPGDFDYGWVGMNGKGYEHFSSLAIIEMGVRMYAAWLGRFLSADPVAGGNTSNYNYPNDPINMFDLDGRIQDCGACSHGNVLRIAQTPRGGTHLITTTSNAGGKQAQLYGPSKPSSYVTTYTAFDIFQYSKYNYNIDHGGMTLSVKLTPIGYASSVVDMYSFSNEGWEKLTARYGETIDTESMRQQWNCHVLGATAEWGTIDLELYRPPNPDWASGVFSPKFVSAPSSLCNWSGE